MECTTYAMASGSSDRFPGGGTSTYLRKNRVACPTQGVLQDRGEVALRAEFMHRPAQP